MTDAGVKGYYSSMRNLSISLRERETQCVNINMKLMADTEPEADTYLDLPTALSPRQMIFTSSSASYFFWSSSGMLVASPAISSLF